MSHALHRRSGLLVVAVGVLAIVAGIFFGETYIPRLPQHHGYYLVAVDDEVRATPPPRPRRTVVVVVDGLRRESALGMKAVAALRAHGQCRVMNVGPLTVSRPVYAILSTGLEADRTGSRNNDETSPLAAESIWEVARQANLEVVGASHLPWFGQLFPKGFTRYHRTESWDADIFAPEVLADLTLFHPIYVDETGHSFGGASARYAAAVQRVDEEMAGLLARVDLHQDAVVFTADHGHSARGGHGSSQPEIADVLTCFAGHGIVRAEADRPLDGRSFAPTLALLLGLRFPHHMRAGEDGLDAIFEIVDTTDAPLYATDRRAAIARFRAENARVVAGWLDGEPGTWSRLYARDGARAMRTMWAGLALVALVVVLGSRRAKLGWTAIASSVAWVVGLYAFACIMHVLMRGSLDFTAVNSRASYLPACMGIGLGSGALAIGVHLALWRDTARLARDQLTAVGVLLFVNVLHPLAFGWPLAFPLPNAQLLVFPFFGAILLAAGGILTLLMGVGLVWRARRRGEAAHQ